MHEIVSILSSSRLSTEFIPKIAHLIDYLVVDSKESNPGWSFPRLSLLKTLQSSRVLSYDIIQDCEMHEIIVGESSSSEISGLVEWVVTMKERDDVSLPCSSLALLVETLDISLRDIYRIAGTLPMQSHKMMYSSTLQLEESDDFYPVMNGREFLSRS